MRSYAIDARMLHAAGIGRYLQNLIPGLVDGGAEERYTLLCDVGEVRAREHAWTDQERVELRECSAPIYSMREQLALIRSIPRDASLFWSPHYNVPLAYRGKLLVTVHDVLHLARPEFVKGAHQRLYAAAMFRAAVRKARAILCVSHFTADELVRYTGAPREKLRVVHSGVDGSWFGLVRGPRPHPRPYLLYIGNVKPHKNLPRLVQAFEAISRDVPHDLVIVGKREGFITGDSSVAALAAALGERVRFTGFIEDDLLRQYLLHADALVFPSLYEGFGFPPLEAMACGCPAIVSNAASLPEVCGDAALYFDPRDPADIARKIRQLLREDGLREELVGKGLERARRFTWERSVSETREVLEEVAGA